jgi:acetyl esterase/lipase
MGSRWWLHVQASVWRFLMRIGMFLHDLTPPRCPSPSFTRTVPSDAHGNSAVIHFYLPPDYHAQKRLGHRYPVLVNFHGGGFTLGCATDDSRWSTMVVQEVNAVVASVSYRRAPENPFPAAVDDGVDALLYLAANAGDLGLDVSRVALSGFSAGGNLAVTVPLRLYSRLSSEIKEHFGRAESTQRLVDQTNELHIVGIFAWYPILDFLESRDHRRAMSLMPDKTLPAFFTTLFDESYLPNLDDRSSAFASPVRATDRMLATLPHDVFLYICEWDMLMKEGQTFVRRLEGLGKRVRAMMIEKACHAWDKSANPFRDQDSVDVLYRDSCAEMKAIFDR